MSDLNIYAFYLNDEGCLNSAILPIDESSTSIDEYMESFKKENNFTELHIVTGIRVDSCTKNGNKIIDPAKTGTLTIY